MTPTPPTKQPPPTPPKKQQQQPPPPPPTPGGPILITITANPPAISPGQRTAVNVYVRDSRGLPIPSAVVTILSGGGSFDRTGATKVSGQTDSSGAFRDYWSCSPCARAYGFGVQVTKAGYDEAQAEFQVDIH